VIPASNAVAPLAQATLPVLARLGAHSALYRQTYVRLVRQLNLLALPTAVTLAFVAQPLVIAVLGPTWSQSGDILQALAPAIAALGFGYAAGDLFITQDRSGELRTLGLVELVVRVAGIAAAARFGVVAVAASFSATTLMVVLLRVAVAGRKGPVSVADHLGAAGPGAVLALGAGLGSLAGGWMVGQFALSALAATLVMSVCAVATGCALALAVPLPRRALIEMVGTVRGSAAEIEAVESPEPVHLVP
jgi:PST family polysaccharide transporter